MLVGRNCSRLFFNIMDKNYRLLLCSFHTTPHALSHPPAPDKPNQEHIDILNKSTLPTEKKSHVTDASNTMKMKAADSFKTTSVFYDAVVSKFVNCMMKGGKKVVSQRVLNDTFETIKYIQLEKYHKAEDKTSVELDPLKIFHQAVSNSMPVLGTQTMKKKGKNFQVPYPLPESRRRFLAIKWLITTARTRPGNTKPMCEKLSKELLDAFHNEGSVIQKKREFHKKAETNRAHAHYRWW